MKIKRFDETELRVLLCGEGGGYYPVDTDEGKRALVLMEEGILQHNPASSWLKEGYKGLTEYGKEYYKAFMVRLAKKHGHVWMTERDSHPDFYDSDDENGNKIDVFAYEVGNHNGMRCKKCGYGFCHHCITEFEVEKCTSKEASA